ncbi:hypothetical protein O9992_02160 [Vibrio lentus]|nr:hypothetical protein [Vibrio lentus]
MIVEDNRTNTIIIETFMNSKGFYVKAWETVSLAPCSSLLSTLIGADG